MIIKEANRKKIEAMIKAAEGRATTRTINFASILLSINCIEEELAIPKKHMVGITASVDYNAQNFPNAYKYTPYSTHFTVKRKSSGWDLIAVSRDITRRENQRFKLTLTEEAREALIKSKEVFR